MLSILNSLPEHVRAQMNEILNPHLPVAVDLPAPRKQAHWNGRGAAHIAIRALPGRIATGAEAMPDRIAERAGSLGGTGRRTIEVAAEGAAP